MKKKRTVFIIVAVLAVVMSILAYSANRYLPGLLHRLVKDKVASLRTKGIAIEYDSLQLSLWRNRVTVDTLSLAIAEKNISAKIFGLHVHSLRLLPLLFHKRVHLKELGIDSVSVLMNVSSKKDTVQKDETRKNDLSFIVDNYSVQHLLIRIRDSVANDTLTLRGSIAVTGFSVNDGPVPWSFGAVQTDSLLVVQSYYIFQVDHLDLDRERKYIHLDTLRIKPRYSKSEHARRKRVEDDRFHGMITGLVAEGLDFEWSDSSFVNASLLKFSFALDIYRNKHYPFPKRTYMPLPVDALKKLPFDLNLDTLRIYNSAVSYEEVGEEADSSGTVYFKKLQAGIFHISTDTTLRAPYMEASALFMGSGKLAITCQFSNTKKPAVLKGSLSDFPLQKMNDMLKPQVKMQVESGVMTKLNFNFKFNDYRSDGIVDISYKDLKLTGLKQDKEKKDKAVKNNLLTLAINTFIKNDAGRFVTGSKQTGIILFYRDRKKAIFNYWWKSLFSGLKSSFSLRVKADKDQVKVLAKKDVEKRKRRKE
ncbi:MAG TPA: DUF748 domain-containing protein [Ohtaekwangia sp.]|uniref:DUF748 domain-containing protein n=1 Tax=Ohtaekwangia sp. TaxID=2066019 RepID=UPI002F93433E